MVIDPLKYGADIVGCILRCARQMYGDEVAVDIAKGMCGASAGVLAHAIGEDAALELITAAATAAHEDEASP